MTFAETQRLLADHCRQPDQNRPPAGIEERRLAIYRELIFNNIATFISSGFPVLKSIYRDADWKSLVGSFIAKHRCQSPYFLEISEEFLTFLQHEHEPSPNDPPFLLELAHYEWVELALDVSTDTFPDRAPTQDLLDGPVLLSPLACSLAYTYPVHRISADWVAEGGAASTTFLVVYRNRCDQVRFLESNAMTARLLELIGAGQTGREAIHQLAVEANVPDPSSLQTTGLDLLLKLQQLDIVI